MDKTKSLIREREGRCNPGLPGPRAGGLVIPGRRPYNEIVATREEIGGEIDSNGRGDLLLTADEVAALLRVTRTWVYAEARAGRIPHVRLGRYVRYRRSAVEAWVEQLEAASTNGAGASVSRWVASG